MFIFFYFFFNVRKTIQDLMAIMNSKSNPFDGAYSEREIDSKGKINIETHSFALN